MKKKKRLWEQLNMADPSAFAPVEEESFSLEDIVREFGGPENEADKDPALYAELFGQDAAPVEEAADVQGAEEAAEPAAPVQDTQEAIQQRMPEVLPEPVPEPEAAPLPEIPDEPEEAAPEQPVKKKKKRRKKAETQKLPFLPEPEVILTPPEPLEPTPNAETESNPLLSQEEAAEVPAPSEEKKKKKRPKKAKPAPEPLPPLSAEEALYDNRQLLGTSRKRLVFCVLLTLLNLALAVYQDAGLQVIPVLNDLRTLSWASVLLFALSLVLCYDVIGRGITQLLRLRPQLETLLSLSCIVVLIDAFQAVRVGRMPCCAAASLELTFALWGLFDGYHANVQTLKTVQTAESPRAVVELPDMYEGRSGLLTDRGDVDRFMEQFPGDNLTERTMRIYAPVMFFVTLVLAIYIAGVLEQNFLWTWSMLLLGALPLCGFICYTRPFSILAKRLAKNGAALSGWAGARIFSGKHAILISDEDLFPMENISFNGMKLCGGYDMDRVISYAAGVSFACDSPLAPMFDELREAQSCRRFLARAYCHYEGGGIGADIMGDVVLMGSLRFMNRMGVHMDGGMKVKQAIYLSINGELACVFAIKYKTVHSVADGLHAVTHDGHFQPVLVTRDFLLDPEFLQSKYGVAPYRLTYPPVKERMRLAEKKRATDGRQGALLRGDGFSEFASAVSGGRTLRSCVQYGTAVAVFSGTVGALLMALMAALGAVSSASCMNLCLFLLVWALPGVILSSWTRKI